MGFEKKKPAPPPQLISDMPEGRYRLIGWDIDTTGRRLIDEVFQVAACYQSDRYAQYIMPHKDLSPFAERRYCIRVVTVSRFRMLKDLRRNKFIKTKSEISALVNFITWLEKSKGISDGIILVYHEVKNISPIMFLAALQRYDLYNRFAAIVKGFCNTCTMAQIVCSDILKSFSLKVLSRVLLCEGDEDFRSAADRARACYYLVPRIKKFDKEEPQETGTGDGSITEQQLSKYALQFTRSTGSELKNLMDFKQFLERQNSFLPIFKELMRYDWVSRQNASRLRLQLVEHNLDFTILKNAWNNGGRRGLKDVLNKVVTSSRKDHFDLIKILECYFDPKKKPVQGNFYKRRNKTFSKSRKNNNNKNKNNKNKQNNNKNARR